ncbi:MAG: arylsulfatase A-like enzyme [Candidatus Binatia bacterium]|jgi:arylsulfatase A-like enzyme
MLPFGRAWRRGAGALAASILVPLGLLLGSLVGVAGCTGEPESAPEPASPTPIILLTIDTLRADHLRFYGYHRDTAPNLAAFAEEAVRFDRAFTPRGKTSPAYSSMFTGLSPRRHGVGRIGHYLRSRHVTAAELLRDDGYRTFGFASSAVMRANVTHLDQGFEVWDDTLPTRESIRINYERRAHDTNRAVLERLEVGDSPLFLFVHWIDPHGPYNPPAEASLRFHTPRDGAKRLPLHRVTSYQRLEGAVTLTDYIDAYDSEIHFVDEQVGLVLARLRSLGLYDRSLIIVTADHGEGLGDHGVYFRHGLHLDDASFRVPLLIKPPSAPSKRRAVGSWEGAVSLVDIMPTLLDYAGVEIPAGLDGRSLRPIVEKGQGDLDRLVFANRAADKHVQDRAAHWRQGSLWALACTARDPNPAAGCTFEYFDAASDPAQISPIREGALLEKLRDALVAHEIEQTALVEDPAAAASEDSPEAALKGVAPDNIEALKALGYVE